ncbi:membrane metallo-endopeptidase-like 1 [Haematobia irritans]|uniref:membrane metallo-endopeptidase-like 1 n=1 Tax=Haematobia irritans TaxID=7368 RepID=UPI003F4F6709
MWPPPCSGKKKYALHPAGSMKVNFVIPIFMKVYHPLHWILMPIDSCWDDADEENDSARITIQEETSKVYKPHNLLNVEYKVIISAFFSLNCLLWIRDPVLSACLYSVSSHPTPMVCNLENELKIRKEIQNNRSEISVKSCAYIQRQHHNLHYRNVVREAKSDDIQNYLNITAEPCENFYNFVCGNYDGLKTPIQDRSPHHRLKTEMDKEIITLLSNDDPSDMEVDKKIKYFFQSCLNVKFDFEKYKQKLRQIIEEFGQMPALVKEEEDQWNESKFDWIKLIGEISFKYDIKLIIGLRLRYKSNENDKATIQLVTPQFALGSRAMYFDDANHKGRETYLEHISLNLRKYLDIMADKAKQLAQDIFDFESALLNATEKSKGISTTIEEMERKFNHLFDVRKFLNLTLGFIPNSNIYDFLDYVPERLQEVFQKTPPKTIANYIFYILLKEFMIDPLYLHETCLPKTHKYFAKNIRVIHNRKYLTADVKDSIEDIWQLIKSNFKRDLISGKHSWLDRESQKEASEKLDDMAIDIRSLKNIDFTEDLKTLKVDREDFINNLKSIHQLNALQNRHLKNHPIYDNSFYRIYYPSYNPLENKILIPASLFKPNFLWSEFYPMALHFATLGVFIAHQLIHGFDEDGHSYDKFGKISKWWSNTTLTNYNNRAKCFSQQYPLYSYLEEPLVESSSQLENIADNGAISLAYKAYLQWLEMCSLQETLESLPNLAYSNKQLFFIAYGQTRCSTSLDFFDDYAMADNTVSDDFRINVPLMNYGEFAHQFLCPAGSSMNPEKKCKMF